MDVGVRAQLGDHPGDERPVTAFEVERAGLVVVRLVLVVDRERAVGASAWHSGTSSGRTMQQSRKSCLARRLPFSSTVSSPVSSTRICGRRRPLMLSRLRRKRGCSAGSAVDSITLRLTPLSSSLGLDDVAEKRHLACPGRRCAERVADDGLGTEKHVVQLGGNRVLEGGQLADRLLDSRERPTTLTVDRLALDVG